MSRELPEKPNLEYLKKQAKELLRSNGQGKLADAQHALAKEYGFATWAKLKSHVEALGLTPAEALKAAVCDSDAPRVAELLREASGVAGEDRRTACPITASASRRCSRRCSEATGRRSMCCSRRAPTYGSGPSGGRADSACWTIAIRAWWSF